MADRYMKRCSTVTILKGGQAKTTTRRHFTPVSMAGMLLRTWRKGDLVHCCGDGNWYGHHGEHYGASSTN